MQIIPQNTSEPIESGLISIRLHGSFHMFRNKSVLIPCDGATYVGGENGSGKTSLIALIPVFYGQSPDKIVSRNANKLSFVDYYLPTAQSMVVFEYRNVRGVQCVVMYRGDQSQVLYRFVSGSASTHLFSAEGLQKMQDGQDVRTLMQWLRKMDIQMSRQLANFTDYRSIIQRSKSLLRRNVADRDKARVESEIFGLGDAQNDLTHLEKMSTGMINKDRLMESLKEIICDSMVRWLHIGTKPDLEQLRRILGDVRVLKDFKRHLPGMQDCILENKKRIEQEARVSLLAKASQDAMDKARAICNDIQQELAAFKATLESKELVHSASLSTLHEKKLNAEARVKHLENRLDQLNQQFEGYQDRSLDEQAKLYHSLPSLRAQLAQSEQVLLSLTLLTGKHEGVRSKALEDLRASLDKQGSQLQQKTKALETELRKKTELQHEEHSRLIHANHAAISALRSTHAEANQHINMTIASHETAAGLIGMSAEDMQKRATLQQALDASRQLVQTSEKSLRQLQDELNQNRQEQEQQAQEHRHLLHMKSQYEQERQSILTQLHPKEGSLLAILKAEDPTWGERIAKVISPGLLLRTDLDPIKLPHDELSIFGWQINVAHLDTPDFVKSEENHKERLLALDALLQDNEQLLEKSQRHASALQQQRQQLIARQQEITIELGRRQDDSRNAAAQLEQADRSIKQAMADKKSMVAQHIQAAKAERERLKSDQSNAIAELESQQREFLMEKRVFWNDELDSLKSEIAELALQESKARSAHATRCKSVEEAYQQSLEKDGVDPAKIKAARTQVDNEKRHINDILDSETQVQEYLLFLRTEWPLRDELQNQLGAAYDDARTVTADIAELTRRFQSEKTQIQDKLHQGKARLVELETCISQADSALRRVDTDGILYADNCVSIEYAELPLNTLAEYLRDNLSQAYHTRERVKKSVNIALVVLQTASNSSRLAQQYHNRVEYRHQNQVIDPLSDAEKFACVNDLEQFIVQDLPQMEDAILASFRVLGNALMTYQDNLGQLASGVKQTSRKLKEILNTNQQIGSFKEITVHLTAKIEHEDGWKPLQHFSALWKEKISEPDADLSEHAVLKSFEDAFMSLDNIRVNNDLNSMIDMRLSVLEGNRLVDLRTTKDLKDVSSTGLSYLLLIVIFMSLSRHLCKSGAVRVAWPLDELDNLSGENFGSIINMLEQHGMYIVTATPDLNPSKTWAFRHKMYLDKGQVNLLTPSSTSSKHYLSKMFGQKDETPQDSPGTALEVQP